MWYMHEGAGWWIIFGGVWMLLIWGGIIGLIVSGISRLTGRNSNAYHDNPLSIAKERYARGDISREEFEELKKNLYN